MVLEQLSLHENELQHRRATVCAALTEYMNTEMLEEAQHCMHRLQQVLPHTPLEENTVFVAYGGGKDSSYMVAFVRYIQLLLFKTCQSTFHLRIATNRHSGMPATVMQNIDRVYRALAVYDDPQVELLLIDGNTVRAFSVTMPADEQVIGRNRLDILMTGHQCHGEARPTFCNACNLSMVNSFGVALSHGSPVNIVITGDSPKEQRAYLAWTRRVASTFGVKSRNYAEGFGAFLDTMDAIAQSYFTNLYGNEAQEEVQQRRIMAPQHSEQPLFFSIYNDTKYDAGSHWDLLTQLLGFEFDDLAFSFTESDCANPSLMAHLRGLKAEHLYRRSYAEGITEYVAFALRLMAKKDFPPALIETMRQRYQTTEAIEQMRRKMDAYALDALDLSEQQLVCMLYSPFIQQGHRMATFLEIEHPELLPSLQALHELLAQPASLPLTTEQMVLAQQLYSLSHLSLEQLRTLYAANASPERLEEQTRTPLGAVLLKDPHKAVITTRHSPNGPVISEMISGR